ncbi:unnamed protein product [Gordionus sp. m RMFG-2023]
MRIQGFASLIPLPGEIVKTKNFVKKSFYIPENVTLLMFRATLAYQIKGERTYQKRNLIDEKFIYDTNIAFLGSDVYSRFQKVNERIKLGLVQSNDDGCGHNT